MRKKNNDIFDSLQQETRSKDNVKNIKNISRDSGYLHDWNEQRRSKRNILLKRLGIFAAAAVLVAAVTIYINMQNLREIRLEREQFLAEYTPAPTQVAEKATPEPIEHSVEFRDALRMYEDAIGYLDIPDTDMSFPIVQGENNFFFENRNLDRSYSEVAATYMLSECDPNISRHLVIYGENVDMKNRLYELDTYLDYDFFHTHEYITLELEQGSKTWQVFSVHLSSTTFNYKDVYFESDTEYLAYIKMFQTMSRFERSVNLTKNDQILTIVTDYHDLDLEEGYLMIHARRVN